MQPHKADAGQGKNMFLRLLLIEELGAHLHLKLQLLLLQHLTMAAEFCGM